MKLFSGGYVGVDVFFVISGFLITTIIVKEIEADEFSIIKFYERRIRRIYPALYVMLLFATVTAFFLYHPQNLTQISKSIMATIGFVSNILFWTESGYFDAPTTLKPLLHTWSLAVEEQFYIVYPLLMGLIMRHARSWLRGILGALALLSFYFSLQVFQQDGSAAFYFMHLRAWELLIGGLLAVRAFPTNLGAPTRHTLSMTGLVMIFGSILIYTKETPFPGASALLPTIGSALVIYSGMDGGSIIGKVLSWPPLVFIGKISYSLYLWHWPIIIFGKYYLVEPPNFLQTFMMIAASFLFSSISWLVVEKPFRSKNFLPSPRIFIFGGSVMLTALVISGSIFLGQGMPERFSKEELTTFADDSDVWGKQNKCAKTNNVTIVELNRCMLGDRASTPSFIVWGDSHAQALAPAIDAAAKSENAIGYLANLGGCPPLLDVYRPEDPVCIDFNHNVFRYIESHPEIETVILVGRWAISADGDRYKTEEGPAVTLVDVQSSALPGSNALLFENGLERTVQKLLELDRRVIIVSTVPEIGYDVPSAYFILLRTGRDINKTLAPSTSEYLQRNAVVNDVLKKLRSRYDLEIIDPAEALCDQNICDVVKDRLPLYRDAHHLSTFGALYIANMFTSIFEK
jgi:peptidoglycan/LPS O-acetylase OafA/YrhL